MKVWFFKVAGPLAVIMIVISLAACGGGNPISSRLATGTALAGGEVAAVDGQDDAGGGGEPEPSATLPADEGTGGGANEDDPGEDQQGAIGTAIQQTLEARPSETPTPKPTKQKASPTPEATITVAGAEFTALANTLTAVSHTATPAPSTPTPDHTETPTPTITPTATPVGWTPSPTTAPCNAVRFVADVSVPDYTVIQPGEWFFKTWRVQNIGSCAWTGEYAMVYHSGYQLGAQGLIWLSAVIPPGHYVNLTIKFRAPTQAGTYDSYWGLRNKEGNFFGIGPGFNDPFYVRIVVPGSSGGSDFTNPVSTDPVFSTAAP